MILQKDTYDKRRQAEDITLLFCFNGKKIVLPMVMFIKTIIHPQIPINQRLVI
jgi:hypothetical protein